MTFEGARAYLLGTINETASRQMPNRLDRMRHFLRELGDPHRRFPTIHVGGTSGKGSTATMIAAALAAAGRKTGLHTKPHLTSMTERARIDGIAIDEAQFALVLGEMMPAIESTALAISRPTYYETLLALAFVYFAREPVDVAVIEVGLGGALDGTNLIEPRVSVITNVGLDHTEILGDSLTQIAGDKVGIAKAGVPLVSDVTDSAVRATIEAGCARAGAPFLSVRDLTEISTRTSERYGQSFVIQTPGGTYDLSVPLLGAFQRRNAATALLALEQLGGDLRPDTAAVQRGFERLVIPGRMEYFPGFPGIIFDIAHNPDKARNLSAALRESFGDRRFTFVVAIGESKNARDVLQALFDLPASFIFTAFETAGRAAMRPQRLVNIAASAGVAARAISDPIEALSIARRSTDGNGVVVVTGSTFVVGTLREWWLSNVGDTATSSR